MTKRKAGPPIKFEWHGAMLAFAREAKAPTYAVNSVGSVLFEFADMDGRNAFPSKRTIAEWAGLERDTINRVLDEMVDAGLLAPDGSVARGVQRWRLQLPHEGVQSGERLGGEAPQSLGGETPQSDEPTASRPRADREPTGVPRHHNQPPPTPDRREGGREGGRTAAGSPDGSPPRRAVTTPLMLEQRAFLRAFGETFADEWKNERLRRADEHPHRDAAAIVTDVMARWPDPVRAARWSIDDEGPPKHGIDRPAGFLLARLRKLPEHPSEDLGDGEDGRGDGGAKRSESPVHIALLLRLEDVVNLWPRVRDRLVGDDGVDVGSAMRSEFGQRLIAGGSRALYPDVMGYSVEHATGQLAVVDDLLAKMRRLKGDTTTTNDAAPPSSPNLTAAPAPPSPGSDR